jgi:peptide/nickel transport system substrate-binding protein
MHAVPRQEIVDKLVVPLNPEATVRNSFLITEGAPGYDEIVADNGSADYAEADPQMSKQLLQQAGVQTPIDVRMMFAEGNVRRENEFALMQPALKAAGFNLIDRRNVDWGSKLGDGTYDAVFFGWQSTSTAVSESQETYKTGGLNNLIGYSNPEVDKLFGELVLTTDEAQQIELQTEIEKLLFEDAIGITIFQFPAVSAWNSARIENIQPAPLAPTIFYGFWEWQVPS